MNPNPFPSGVPPYSQRRTELEFGLSIIVFQALPGGVVQDVLQQLGPAALAGNIVIELTNPLDFSNGMPPTLSIVNDDPLGERVQAALQESRIVKTLNTFTASLMVNPGALAYGDNSMFTSGNDFVAAALGGRWATRISM
jgi:predicted dinucleotide-binding enzyme